MRKFNKALMRVVIVVVAVSVLLRVSFVIASGAMTNADVINLINAKMGSDIIVSAIRGADETAFDTSPNKLIVLKNAGVPDVVIQEMIGSSSSGKSGASPASDTLNPEEVVSIDDGVKASMRYLIPRSRSARRGFGAWGGAASYAVLPGPTAVLRLSSQPSFMISIPGNAQAVSYFTLIHLAQRKNNTREILTSGKGGGAFASHSFGYPQERMIAVTTDLATDQSKAPEGFTIYVVTPSEPLKRGEYAVTVASQQARNYGYFLAATGNTFFDFGVD